MHPRIRRCIAALAVAFAVTAPACEEEVEVECDGEDHRPVAPDPGNACHEAYTLKVRFSECTAGLFDEPANKGINGRNATLASYYAMADYASAAELSQCEVDADHYSEQIAGPGCAAPSTDCGPAAGAHNPCHDYFEALADYRLRCDPETYPDEGMESFDAFLASSLAKADYATADEQDNPCASGLHLWQGDCPPGS